MKRPGVTGAVVHGVLLLLALGVAYFDWTRPKTTGKRATDVTVWEGSAADVKAVHLETELAKVDLEIKKDEGSGKPYPWFRLQRTVTLPAPVPPPPPPAEKKPDEHADHGEPAKPAEATPPPAPAPPAAPQTKVTVKEFLGAERTKERLEKLATLTAERDLGKVDAVTLGKLGLEKPRGTLRLETAKGERKLELGDTAVGDRLRYVRDPESGKVYAVDTNVVSDLEQADTRLLNADLFPFNAESIERATVAAGTASRSYAQLDRDKPGKAYWAVAGAEGAEPAGEKDERASTWFGKLARLKAERYLATDENPLDSPTAGAAGPAPTGPVDTKPVLRIEYQVPGFPPSTLEMTKVSAGADKVAFVVRTNHTRSRVVVNRFTAEEIEKDLADLLS